VCGYLVWSTLPEIVAITCGLNICYWTFRLSLLVAAKLIMGYPLHCVARFFHRTKNNISTMSSLNLHFEDDGLSDAGPGRYSDKKTFDVYQRYLQPDGNLSIVQAATMIVKMLPGPTGNYHRGGELGMFAFFTCDVAQQIPYQHPSQLKLVRLIQYLGNAIKLNAVESVQVGLEATSSKRNRQDALPHEYTFYTSLRDLRYRLREWPDGKYRDDSLIVV
jgi:hypothetical protein